MKRVSALLPDASIQRALAFYGSVLAALIAAGWTLYVHFLTQPSVILVSKDRTIDCEEVNPGPAFLTSTEIEGEFAGQIGDVIQEDTAITGRIRQEEKSLITSDEARVRLTTLYLVCKTVVASDLSPDEKMKEFTSFVEELYGLRNLQ